MIRFQRITTADAALYAFMEQLLQASFPAGEYRSPDELRVYTDEKPCFSNNVIMDGDVPVGLAAYWDFGSFCYVEHLAVDPRRRNGGYGARAVHHLCALSGKPVVLEVELPDNETARRRIGFYRRLGFVLWDGQPYRQPPYKPGDGWLPMYLMAHGGLDGGRDFGWVRERIYKEVYNAVP